MNQALKQDARLSSAGLSSLLGLPGLWPHLASGLGGVTERKRSPPGHSSSVYFCYFFNSTFALALNLTLLLHSH